MYTSVGLDAPKSRLPLGPSAYRHLDQQLHRPGEATGRPKDREGPAFGRSWSRCDVPASLRSPRYLRPGESSGLPGRYTVEERLDAPSAKLVANREAGLRSTSLSEWHLSVLTGLWCRRVYLSCRCSPSVPSS